MSFSTLQSLLALSLCFGLVLGSNAQNSTCDLHSVCFAIDESGSIKSSFNLVRNFVTKVVDDIALSSASVRYSAYTFSSSARLLLSDETDVSKFNAAVSGHKASGGGTNIYRGMNACFNELKAFPDSANKVIVLVTDGQDRSGAQSLIPDITKAGISVVTVGIGSGINTNVLKTLATRPEYFVPVKSASELITRALFVSNRVCDVVDVSRYSCVDEYNQCEFIFMGYHNRVPQFKIGARPDVAFTRAIVSRNDPDIGILNTNGIAAEFLTVNGFQPITQFGNPKLTPTHFKPLSIKHRHFSSGIGHQTFTGNQLFVSRNQCVRVFFTHYQLVSLSHGGNVIGNVNGAMKSDKKCVVFQTI